MAKTRKLMLAVLGACLLMGNTGCFTLYGVVPWPILVPPWVSERMEEKYTKRLWEDRTPVLPPILPGTPLPTCDDPPSEEQVIRALPRVARGVPFIYEEFRDDYNVVIEKIVDQIDPCTYVPLIGPAQLHHCHYRCTVFWKEKLMSCYPFPFTAENDRCEVIYIDKDHFHLCVGPDDRMQRSISRDLMGP